MVEHSSFITGRVSMAFKCHSFKCQQRSQIIAPLFVKACTLDKNKRNQIKRTTVNSPFRSNELCDKPDIVSFSYKHCTSNSAIRY